MSGDPLPNHVLPGSHAAPGGTEASVTPRVSGEEVGVRKITSGFGWMALSSYSTQILGLLSTLILAKMLSPTDFGIVGIASMMLAVIQLLKDMGLSEAVIYSKRGDRKALDTAHTVLVAYNVFLFLIAAAAAPFAASFYDTPIILPVVVLMSSNLVITSFRAVPLTLIRKNLEFRKLVLPEIVPVAVSSLVSIGLALAGFGVWSLVAKGMLQSVLALIVLQFITSYRPRFAFDRGAARELFEYGKFIVGTSMLLVALYNIDKFYVSTFAGIAALGMFELGIRIAELPVKQFSFLIGSVMFPVYSRMGQSGHALRTVFLKILKYTASITLPAAVGLAVFGPALVWQIYGEKWEGLGGLLRVLALYAALRSVSSIVYDLFKATGNPQLMQRASLFKLTAIALLGIPAIHAFGVQGIAGLIVLTYAAALSWELRRLAEIIEIRLSVLVGVLLKPIALAATTIPGTYALLLRSGALESLWGLGIGMCVAGVTYAVLFYWTDDEAAHDVRAFWVSRTVSSSDQAVRSPLPPG